MLPVEESIAVGLTGNPVVLVVCGCQRPCARKSSRDQVPNPTAHPSLCLEGFVESELKKILAVQREARLWKVGNPEGRELLTQPDITLEEAGMVDGQVCPHRQTDRQTQEPVLPVFLFVWFVCFVFVCCDGFSCSPG